VPDIGAYVSDTGSDSLETIHVWVGSSWYFPSGTYEHNPETLSSARRAKMFPSDVRVVLVHGAWADGSSWAKLIGPRAADGIRAMAAPLPLTSSHDDVAALDRTLERVLA